MNTECMSLSKKAIYKVIEHLKAGSVVVFPTDSVYGLIADASNENAIKKVYSLKNRNNEKPLGYLTNKEKAFSYGYFCDDAKKISLLWPGPINIIVPKSNLVPDSITKGYSSILMICPDNFCVELSNLADFPIVCTSANMSGEKPIVTFKDASITFYGKVPLIVDGGTSRYGASNTIIDFSRNTPTILRIGPYPVEKIRKLIPNTVMANKLI